MKLLIIDLEKLEDVLLKSPYLSVSHRLGEIKQAGRILDTDESIEEKLDENFRSILSHAFLGEDENISREAFDKAVEGCVQFAIDQKIIEQLGEESK